MRHAGGDRPDACTCRTRRSTRPATSPGTGRSSASTSRPTTSSCRWPRATRRSSTRRCSTAPAPTARPTSGGWPTCCRCPRRSAGRWRRVDRDAMSRGALPGAARRTAGAGRLAGNVVAAVGRGLRLPDQPRPRPAGRRPGPADPGGAGRQALAEGWDEGKFREGPGRQQPATPPTKSRVSTSTTASPCFRDGESRFWAVVSWPVQIAPLRAIIRRARGGRRGGAAGGAPPRRRSARAASGSRRAARRRSAGPSPTAGCA